MAQKPTNTSKQDPIVHLAESAMFGSSQAIERSEAKGQEELVNSTSLPTSFGLGDKHKQKAALEAAGVVFGEFYPDDPMFCEATLPEGWKKEATEHSMWSRLLDDKGRERALIFYKAAFYDRRADISVCTRYTATIEYDHGDWDTRKERGLVKDGEIILFETPWVPPNGEIDCEQVARNWLCENFPDWKNPAAYWD